MDSPTIPERLQLHERSRSAPGTCSRPTLPKGARDSPIPVPPVQPQGQYREWREAAHVENTYRDPAELDSSCSLREASVDSTHPRTPSHNTNRPELDGLHEVPPAVPPKSPRTAGRATPVLRDPRCFRNVAHVPLQNAVNPGTKGQDQVSSDWGTTPQSDNGLSLQRKVPAASGKNRPSSEAITNRSDVVFDCRQKHDLPGSNSPVELEAIPAGTSSPLTGRWASPETSMIDRGRPTKRIAGVIKRNPSKSVRTNPMEIESTIDLPTGISVTEASHRLSRTQIRDLRNEAVRQAEQFEVLQGKDVEALSKELHLLDERCEYLRSTQKSLRLGRRSLHTRTIAYLRFPMTARISQESMLKQEKALTELDDAMDDWASKLEQAEDRRSRVRQRLHEHMAAVLSLQTVDSHSSNDGHLQTPPMSPERLLAPEWGERKDVESIKIYADSDMYASLANSEKEICVNRDPEGSADSVMDPGVAVIQPDSWRQASRRERAI